MSVKIDQAFIKAYIDAGLGLDIAHENTAYEPTAGTEYAELLSIPNDITPFSLNDSNETDGLFRIILRWPVNKGSIQAKLKADEIMAVFGIGAIVCYAGQCATVTRQSRAEAYDSASKDSSYANSVWYKLVITIGYTAIIKR